MKKPPLGQAIRIRRKELGVDQRTLSELSGVSVHTISDIESGKGNPTLSTVEDLLNVLGLELTLQARKTGDGP
jgi:y4mF family transcriptional regulator